MKNFHLPLSDEAYAGLRAEAARAQVPATALAREAIDAWLRQQIRNARHEQIAAWAAEFGASDLDLDRDLEVAAIEHVANTDKRNRGKRK
jgi:hypothetical protein